MPGIGLNGSLVSGLFSGFGPVVAGPTGNARNWLEWFFGVGPVFQNQ